MLLPELDGKFPPESCNRLGMSMFPDPAAKCAAPRYVVPFLALTAVLLGPLSSPPDARAASPRAAEMMEKHSRLCTLAANRAERRYRIPRQLLAAISLAESGRYSRRHQATFAWPWTVRSGRFSRYLPSRKEAIALVRRLQAKGVKNIDIGCMQVNLAYHPDAFANLQLAFNPADNVDYAARLLTRLHERKRSWALAVGHYHSSQRQKRLPYWRRVVKFWNSERRRAARERRGRIIAAYERRRAERLAAQAQRRTRLLLQGQPD